jgi:hypothetical protein
LPDGWFNALIWENLTRAPALKANRALNLHKYSFFLALLTGVLPFAQSQSTPVASPAGAQEAPQGVAVANGVLQIGHISMPRLTECSGIVASRQYPGTFWVHNDGGGPKRQILYGMTRQGQPRGEFRLLEVTLSDWEDIAIDGAKHIYIGDIGNNDAKRDELAVYQVDEPNPSLGNGFLRVTKSWRLHFPGQRFDCESLFVWKEYGYVVSKVFKDARAEIYRFPLADSTGPVTLESVAKTKIESPVTGADISADGKLLALVAKSGAFVYNIDGDVTRAHKEKGYQTKFRHEHIEGCCFVPEGLLCTAESREIFLFTDPPFRGD